MIYIILILAIIIAELFIKDYVEKHLIYGKERKICGDKFSITKYYNRGACMNFLEKKPAVVRWISSGMLGAILVYFFWILPRKGASLIKVALSCVIGGAISNLLDRLYKGYVIDYLIINKKKLKHIIFNLGDVMIFLGSVILVIRSFISRK